MTVANTSKFPRFPPVRRPNGKLYGSGLEPTQVHAVPRFKDEGIKVTLLQVEPNDSRYLLWPTQAGPAGRCGRPHTP